MTLSKSFIWQAIMALLVAAASWIGLSVHPSSAAAESGATQGAAAEVSR
jgi:hypothetical protein